VIAEMVASSSGKVKPRVGWGADGAKWLIMMPWVVEWYNEEKHKNASAFVFTDEERQ